MSIINGMKHWFVALGVAWWVAGLARGAEGVATPNNLQASDGESADKIRVSWDAVPEASGYRVYRATNAVLAEATLVGESGEATFGDASIAPDTLYYYWVAATNASGASLCSLPDSGFVKLRDKVLAQGLIAHFQLDGDGRDATGHGHDPVSDATTMTAVADRSKNSGQAMASDGGYSDSAGYELVDTTLLNGASNATVSAWIQWTAGATEEWHQVFSVGDERGSLDPISTQFTGKKPTNFSFYDTVGGRKIENNFTYAFEDQTWYHLAIVLQRVGDGSRLRVFVNGQWVADTTSPQPIVISYDQPMKAWIGCLHRSQVWAGLLDDIRVYERALSGPEIASLFSYETTYVVITQQPQAQTVMAGAGATFQVGALGAEPITYQWYQDNAAIPAATRSVLTLERVQTNQAGPYQVAVSNAYGVVWSDKALLNVRVGGIEEATLNITRQPASQTAFRNANVDFTVAVQANNPVDYQWWFNGQVISGAISPTCHLTTVQPEQAGAYFVIVSSGGLSATSAVATLVVNEAPPIVPGKLRWEFVASEINSIYSDPALGLDGTLYFMSYGNPSRVYALDGETGAKRWSFSLPGGTLFGSPVVGANGMIYVGGCGRFYILNPLDGSIMREFKPDDFGPPLTACLGKDGTLYVKGGKNSLYAFDPMTLQLKWNYLIPSGSPDGGPPVTDDAGNLYFMAGSSTFYSLDPNMTKRWEYQIPVPAGTKVNNMSGAPALSPNGLVIFGWFDHAVYALNTDTGALLWKFPGAGGFWSSPAIDSDGVAYIGCDDGNLFAIDTQTGKQKWKFKRGGYWDGAQCSSPVLGENGELYVGEFSGIVCLDRITGGLKWKYATPGTVFATPALGANGTLYVPVWNGKRIQALGTASTNGLYASAWPRHGRDSQNTGRLLPSGPAILTQPVSQFVAVGDTATFSVTVAPGSAVTYQWRFNDAPIDGAIGGQLTLTSVRKDQQGSYVVWVSNDRATTKSARALLTVNSPPTLSPLAHVDAPEEVAASATIAATDAEGQTLRYRFEGAAPPGAAIDANSGRFSWTPDEAQGPGVYPLTVVVSDSGTPSLSATQILTVAVSEVNVAPRLAAVTDQPVNEGSTLTLSLAATDADFPTNRLSFSLSSGAPAGAMLDQNTGVFTWTPSVAQSPGTYPITVQVADDGVPPLSDPRTFTVTVAQTTQAPAITSPPQKLVVTNGATAVFRVTATGTAPLQYQWFLDGHPLPEAIAPELTIAPVQTRDAGLYTVTVTNLRGTQTSAAAGLTINTPPAAAGQSPSTDEDVPLTILLTGSDPDGDSLNYQLASRPTHGKLTGKSPNLVYTPDTNYFGADSFSFSVNDGWVDSAQALIEITVKPVNDAPMMAPIADLSVNENELLRYVVTATDVDAGDVLAYRLAPDAPTGANIDAVSGEFTWTPGEAQSPSTHRITVTATDLGGLSATQTLTVIVREVNSAPVLVVISDQQVNEGSTLTLNLSATDADVPTNRLSFSLSSGEPAGAILDKDSGVFTWTPSVAQSPGTYPITVQVADDGVPPLSDPRTFMVTVAQTTQAPAIVSPPQALVVTHGATAVFHVTATGTAPLQYQWFRDGNPISGATNPELTITPAQTSDAGLYTVSITNLRGTQTSAAAGLTINTPPTAAGQSLVTDEDVPLVILLTGGDPDGDSLNYQLASRPTHGKLTGKSPNLVYTPDTNYFGTDSFSFSVNDGWVDSAPALIAITVKPVNDAPVMAPIADLSVNENEFLHYVVTATDVDAGDVLAYRLAPTAPTGTKLDAVTGEFTWTPGEAQSPSTHRITVTATDLGGVSATQTFTVIVREVNSAPVLADIPSRTVSEGTALVCQAVATDADIPANRLTFSLEGDVPAGAHLDALTGRFSWTPSAAQAPSTNSITLRVTDDGVPPMSSAVTFRVFVEKSIVPPTILTQPADQTVVPGGQAAFRVVVTGTAPFDYQWLWKDQPLPGATNDALVLENVLASQAGFYAVRVANPRGSVTSSNALLRVNSPPLAQPQSLVTDEDAPLVILLTGNDPDGDSLNYQLASRPTHGKLTGKSPDLVYTPDPDYFGADSFAFTINDGRVDSAPARIAITVKPVNDAPVMTPLADLTVNESELLRCRVTATEVDAGDVLAYRLAPTAPAGTKLDAVTGEFTWTPGEAQGPSTHRITVTATDLEGLCATQTFTVIVREVNSAPVLAALPSRTVSEGTALVCQAVATDADIPANRLTFSTEGDVPAGARLDALTGRFSWTPSAVQAPSTNSITLRVTDDGVPPMSSAVTFRVFVEKSIVPPTILTQPADQTVVPGGQAAFRVVVAGTAPFDYQWLWQDQPLPGATNDALVLENVLAGQAGVYAVRVANPRGSVTSSNALLRINSPPLAQPQSLVTDEDAPLVILLTGGDPDGDSLNYQLASRPAHGKLTGKSPNLVYTPDTHYFGADSFAFTVNDGRVDSAPARIAITVKPVNDAPVMAPLADLSVNESELLRYVVTATDVDAGDVLAYRLAPTAPTGTKLDAVTGEFTWTPGEAQGPSTNRITVTATDLGGLSATQTFTVVVREVNRAPVLTAIPSQTVKQGDTLRLQAVGKDPDWPTNRLTFSLGPGFPAGVQIDAVSGEILWTVAASQSPGTNPVTVIVSDNGDPAYAATNSFTVVVNQLIKPPVILTGPQSQTVVEGAAVSLAVEAEGDTPLFYQWRKGGVPIAGATNASFAIRMTQLADAGNYSVTVANAARAVDSLPAQLLVQSPDLRPATLEGQITDALDGAPVSAVSLTIGGCDTRTDATGWYRFTNLVGGPLQADFDANVRAGNAPLTVRFFNQCAESTLALNARKTGYLSYTNARVNLQAGETSRLDFSLSPANISGLRFVLNWGAKPRDLDAHLLVPPLQGANYEVSYNARGTSNAPPYALLDIDRTEGFGPETISVTRLQTGVYRYYVHNFKDEQGDTGPFSDSGATVQIYTENGLARTIQAPRAGTGDYWDVCTIDGVSGVITIRNITTPTRPSRANLEPPGEDPGHPAEPGGDPASLTRYRWDFGDGTTSVEESPSKRYDLPGVYDVSLLVQKEDGRQDILVKNAFVAVTGVSNPRPVLNLRRAGASVVASWTSPQTVWILESKTRLSDARWESVTQIPESNNGTNYSVTLPWVKEGYFRLRNP